MRNLFLMATIVCFCSNVFAFTITGKKAAELNKSLLEIGAVPGAYSTANSTFILLRFVECKKESGVILSPTTCSFKDLSYNDFLELSGDKADKLFNALKKSGVKPKNTYTYEHMTESIVLEGLECITAFSPKYFRCEIAD